MPPIRIRPDAELPYVIDSARKMYIVETGVRIETDPFFSQSIIQEGETARSNNIRIDGIVRDRGFGTALDMMGDRTNVVIGKSGVLSVYGTDPCVRLAGVDQTFINNGKVRGDVSLWEAEDLKEFQNNGIITGSITLGRSEFQFVLGKESRVGGLGEYLGISRDADAGVATTTINNGYIKASNVFESFDGDETFVNNGILDGYVELGAGNDVFNSLNGRFSKEVYGGAGDDTYYFKNFYAAAIEKVGEGYDIVKSKSDCMLGDGEVEVLMLLGKANASAWGSQYDNLIFGNSGKNMLEGNSGNDTLEGGEGADTFAISTGDGHDIVTDFKAGTDRLSFINWDEMLDLDAVLERAAEVDGGVLIEEGDDSLFLAGVMLQDLTARDFSFWFPI